MELHKLSLDDLSYKDDYEPTTYVKLNDYTWMDYRLIFDFETKEGINYNVEFDYFGMVNSKMKVFTNTGLQITYTYRFEIFQKYITRFLLKHIRSWNEEYAFSGEEIALEFFNEVIEKGSVEEKIQKYTKE